MTGGAGDASLRLLGCNDAGFFEPGFRSSPMTSVQELEPGSSLITALTELGIDPAVDFHSIIPSRGRGAGDGIVPHASAHLEGAASELFIIAGHACLEEREVIRETARILAQHIAPDTRPPTSGRSFNPMSDDTGPDDVSSQADCPDKSTGWANK